MRYVFFACMSLALFIYLLSIIVFQVEPIEPELKLETSVLSQEKQSSD
jgi:hypothetical protein